MTDYVAITDTQIEPDAPVTAALAGQWRDNPIAVSEGAPDAPKVYGAAFGPGYWLGFRTASPAEYVDVDLTNTRWLKVEFTAGSIGEIQQSDDGGVTLGTSYALLGPIRYIDLQTGDTIRDTGTTYATTASDFVPLSGCNAVRFTLTALPGDPILIDLYAIQGRTVW
jgi:hypothetical protein